MPPTIAVAAQTCGSGLGGAGGGGGTGNRIHDAVWCFLQQKTLEMLESDFMTKTTARLSHLLTNLGVPPPHPEPDQIALCFTAVVSTLLLYFLLFGKRHRRRRKMLAKDLRDARRRVQELEEKLLEMEVKDEGASPRSKKPIRIWMDGCFDMMHYGHMNAFRQGKSLGTYLVVGVNSDATIIACKGPPVMNDEERLAAVEGCRFVDEVVPGVPYVMDEDYLKSVMEKYKIDYVVHGDDPCIVNGRDVYELPQKMGKYRTIPRTEGVSTTDIVGRMLLMSTRHHQRTMSCGSQTGQLASDKTPAPPTMNGNSNAANPHTDILLAQERSEESSMTFYRRSRFLTTSRMIRLFSAGMRTGPPHKDSKVVYMDGSWDMFHPGHIKTLKKIKHDLHLSSSTDTHRHTHTQPPIFLIIGVHNDQVVNQHRGSNFPIMNLHERVLSVLGCKYVDDVLIDAPYTITREMIASLNISLVLHGTHKDDYDQYDTHTHSNGDSEEEDPFKIPKEMGIFQEISSDCDMSVREVIGRIQRNQEQYISKYSKKKVAEDAYYDTRYQTHTQTQKEGQAAAPPAAVAGNGKGR